MNKVTLKKLVVFIVGLASFTSIDGRRMEGTFDGHKRVSASSSSTNQSDSGNGATGAMSPTVANEEPSSLSSTNQSDSGNGATGAMSTAVDADTIDVVDFIFNNVNNNNNADERNQQERSDFDTSIMGMRPLFSLKGKNNRTSSLAAKGDVNTVDDQLLISEKVFSLLSPDHFVSEEVKERALLLLNDITAVIKNN